MTTLLNAGLAGRRDLKEDIWVQWEERKISFKVILCCQFSLVGIMLFLRRLLYIHLHISQLIPQIMDFP